MRHFKILHYLLKDKKNYHKDQELAQSWETYLFYLGHVRQMSAFLIKQKLLYFIKFKKIYITKVLLTFTILAGALFYGGKFLLEHNNFFEVKRVITNTPMDTIYCPDSIPIDRYIERTARIAGTSKDKILKKVAFVTFYSEDTLKTAEKWLKALSQLESGQNPKAENGIHWGAWQMGARERASVGFGGVSKKDFMGSRDLQKAAVILYLKSNYRVLKPYLDRYNNRIIRGYHLTLSGMLAMSHNCGTQGLITFLNSNCTVVPHDGNMASTNYLTLGNYNIKELLTEK